MTVKLQWVRLERRQSDKSLKTAALLCSAGTSRTAAGNDVVHKETTGPEVGQLQYLPLLALVHDSHLENVPTASESRFSIYRVCF